MLGVMAETEQLVLREHEGGVSIEVRVAPRSSRSAIVGARDGALRVSLTAPPVEGEANAALIELLARTLSVPKRAVRILRGERGRQKIVAVDDLTVEQATTALLQAMQPKTRR
jgi:uncharacterized protein (TIGR00251 family)